MKKFMITGGFLGFVTGLVLGLAQQSPWPSVLWRASVAALLAGLLIRWWGQIWIRSLQQILQDQAEAQANADASSAVNQPSKT